MMNALTFSVMMNTTPIHTRNTTGSVRSSYYNSLEKIYICKKNEKVSLSLKKVMCSEII
jgi:hypothetical protein